MHPTSHHTLITRLPTTTTSPTTFPAIATHLVSAGMHCRKHHLHANAAAPLEECTSPLQASPMRTWGGLVARTLQHAMGEGRHNGRDLNAVVAVPELHGPPTLQGMRRRRFQHLPLQQSHPFRTGGTNTGC